MKYIFKVVSAPGWIFYQTAYGTARFPYLWVPFTILVALAWRGFVRRDVNERKRLWIPILLLPAIWIAIGLFAGIFWRDPSHPLPASGHFWLEYTPVAGVMLSLITSISFIFHQRGARLFLVSYSIINIYISVMAAFIAGMAVTGVWI